MKKLSYLTNLFLIGILVASFIKNKDESNEMFEKNTFCDSTKICMDYSRMKPYNYLNKDLLSEMSANYDTTAIQMGSQRFLLLPGINALQVRPGKSNHVVNKIGSPFKEDSRSIWFSLDSLKRFIWEIETTICKNQCRPKNLGIRLYYARYPIINKANPNHTQLLALNPNYQNMQTIFMIPTYEKNMGRTIANIDFDPRKFSLTNGCEYTQIEELPKGWRPIVFTAIPNSNQLAKNHGTLCPTECEGSAF